jgi:excisionase family DNA binding protein
MGTEHPRPLTLVQAALALGCSTDTIKRWARLGRIHTFKAPGGVRVPASEVERLLRGESRS